MGFKKVSKEEIDTEAMSFRPMDLNEDSIRALVERCFATWYDPEEDQLSVRIVSSDSNFGKGDTPIVLSKSRSVANRQNIQYLFGQLKIAHKEIYDHFSLLDAVTKYDGTQWTGDMSSLLNLIYLSKVFGSEASCLKKESDGTTIVLVDGKSYIPTLSPKDHDFDKWYNEEYLPKMKDWKWPEIR